MKYTQLATSHLLALTSKKISLKNQLPVLIIRITVNVMMIKLFYSYHFL